ncbi:MAG: hypothetical protein NVS9B10_06720 [Nevskia sp.]
MPVPAGFRAGSGPPFGTALIAPAFSDDALAALAARLPAATGSGLDRSAVIPPAPAAAADRVADGTVVIGAVGTHEDLSVPQRLPSARPGAGSA